MNTQLTKDAFGWGTLLWFFGYILGILFFMIVPAALIGWIIMPLGTVATLWVLFRRVHGNTIRYYLTLSVVWTVIAVVFDYLFIVTLLKPADGYYKADVYLYYVLTFVLPFFAAKLKKLL